MKKVEVVSDYTSLEEPNILQLIRDSQGDVHINMVVNSDSERGVRIASSGTRVWIDNKEKCMISPKVREAFYHLIETIEEDCKLKDKSSYFESEE